MTRTLNHCTIHVQTVQLRDGGYRAWGVDHRILGSIAETVDAHHAITPPAGFAKGVTRARMNDAVKDARAIVKQLIGSSKVHEIRVLSDSAELYHVEVITVDDAECLATLALEAATDTVWNASTL